MKRVKKWLFRNRIVVTEVTIATWVFIFWLLILLGVATSITSCSPLKRLERLEKRHPYLFEKITDTITITDTIRVTIPGTQIDTFVHYSRLIDTVIIEKNGIKTTVWQKGDTVFVNTKQDTIYISVPYTKKVPVKRYETYRRPRDSLRWLWVLIPISALVIIIRYKTNKRKPD